MLAVREALAVAEATGGLETSLEGIAGVALDGLVEIVQEEGYTIEYISSTSRGIGSGLVEGSRVGTFNEFAGDGFLNSAGLGIVGKAS